MASQSEVPATVNALAHPGEYQFDDPHVLLVRQTNEEYTLLFVANPTPLQREVTMRFPGMRRLKRVWGEVCNCSGEGAIALQLEPYTVQIWEVLHD